MASKSQLPSSSDVVQTARSLMRSHWTELTDRLWADRVTDTLYERRIISEIDKAEIEKRAERSRHEGAAYLVDVMSTRSRIQAVQFAYILSDMIGIDDLGWWLVSDARDGDDIDITRQLSREQESLVKDKESLVKDKESLVKDKESLVKDCQLLERKEKRSRMLNIGYEIERVGKEKASVVTECKLKWEPWKRIPSSGGYMNRVATVQDKVIAADYSSNQFRISDIHSSHCCWSTVGNTHNTSGGEIHTLFNAGEECLGTFHKKGGKRSIGKYTVNTNKWQHVTDISSDGQFCGYGIAADRHHVFVVGGRDSENGSEMIKIFDMKIGAQCDRVKMSSKRVDCWCSIIDNMLYVGGGWDGTQWLDTIECVSLSDHIKHDKIAPTPTFQCSVTSFCGLLVMIGGMVGRYLSSLSSNKFAVLTPSLSTWLSLPAMNQQRWLHGPCAIGDDTLMVLGGWDGISGDGISSVEVLKM